MPGRGGPALSCDDDIALATENALVDLQRS